MMLRETHMQINYQGVAKSRIARQLPLERPDATFLFEVINKRYQAQKSILTSNKSFGQWDEIFPDPALAIALFDRLLHHATTLNIRGESYRLRHRRHAGLAVPAQL